MPGRLPTARPKYGGRTVDEVKQALGERGLVWWDDGSPDLDCSAK
ncbi:hypothetical protein GGD65_005380 [Bradyrhizobium sp. CIR18]|nr:hypothetical protein [Bradyrhizobium sp. CIR18]MBB4364322.1 hypothetical protein [Bradyrhizobium sp. CIR18]